MYKNMFNSCLYNCIYSLNVFNFGVLAFVLLSRCLNFNNFEESLSPCRVYGNRMDCNIKNEKTAIPRFNCNKNVLLMVFNFYSTSLIFVIRNYGISVIFPPPPYFLFCVHVQRVFYCPNNKKYKLVSL